MMDCYLFPRLFDDEPTAALDTFRERDVEICRLFPALLSFVARDACTAHTVREYVVRRLLQSPPAFWDRPCMEPYLRRDAALVFDRFFTVDWDERCEDRGYLPFPRTQNGQNCGETAYRVLLGRMVEARSSERLAELLADFFDAYSGEDEARFRAFRWENGLVGIPNPDTVSFEELWGLEQQKQAVIANTQAFLDAKPANDILLAGSGGAGKSSCVKAALNHFADHGLRLAELSGQDLAALPALMEALARQKRRYILYLDDLSFENADADYLHLKVALEGRASKRPANVLLYATSNRRHLVRESWRDRDAEDVHPGDTMGEKLSLASRFGIRLVFPMLSQTEYLQIVRMLLEQSGEPYSDVVGQRAAAWAAHNNGRSGRSARQFVNHLLGQGQ